ncbi:MAG: hypothetical protein R3E12_10815 [Candidatus Eisenbacteria bacterium]
MTPPGVVRLELGALGLDRGGRLLLAHALERLGVGDVLNVIGEDPALAVHLRAWARASGHSFEPIPDGGRIRVERTGLRSSVERERAGDVDPHHPGAVAEHPPLRWGLAARGADVDVAARDFDFTLSDKTVVWSDDASRIYAQAVAAQWDPLSAIDWNAPFELPEEIEDAVVQVMTYLIENETAALIIPARFAGRIHPHFREVMQVLAIQAADEARHIEVFTRRATLRRDRLGSSSAGGQASLKTLLDEPDFALASFLLSVLGRGRFSICSGSSIATRPTR